MAQAHLQGGVKFPIGGKCLDKKVMSPRALYNEPRCTFKGQQIWLKSKADGDSPDERRVVVGAIFSYCDPRASCFGIGESAPKCSLLDNFFI